MKIDTLTELLTKHVGARKDGAGFLVPPDAEASLLVALEGETLAITKVTRVEMLDTMVLADTMRGERYAVAVEDIRALKIDKLEATRNTRGAGFGK